MAYVKLSELPAAASVASTDELETNQGGTSRKATAAQLRAGLATSGAVTTSGLTMTTARVLGRTTAATGAIEELTSVPVSLGGTGATTDASARSNLGLGSAATMAGPTSTIVGTTDTQTLTNKTLTGARETRVAVAASNIDLLAGSFFTRTISGVTTLTVSNVPTAGTAVSFVLDLTNGGSATVNWWTGVRWAKGTAPTLTAAGRDVLGFYTHDGGTTWTGLLLGLDVK